MPDMESIARVIPGNAEADLEALGPIAEPTPMGTYATRSHTVAPSHVAKKFRLRPPVRAELNCEMLLVVNF
jgi:hypothetical protein